jgi:hypothetical protein
MPKKCIFGVGYNCKCSREGGCRRGYTREGTAVTGPAGVPCESEINAGNHFDPKTMFAPKANMPGGEQTDDYEGCLITLGKTWTEENVALRERLLGAKSCNLSLESLEAYLEVVEDTDAKTGKIFKRELLMCSCHFPPDMIVASGTAGAWKFHDDAVPMTPGQLKHIRGTKSTSRPVIALPKLRNASPLERHLYQEAEEAYKVLATKKSEIDVLRADLNYVLEEHAKAEIATQNTRQALMEAELQMEQMAMEVEIL